jgi:hypothetical protein
LLQQPGPAAGTANRGGGRTWKEAEKLTENGEDAMTAKTDAKVQIVDESIG